MVVCKPVDGEEILGKQFTYPQFFDLALLVVFKFAHILLEFFYFGPRGDLLVFGHFYGFLEIFDNLFGRFDIVSNLYVMD